MDNLSDLVQGVVNQLGRAFFMAGFLPALILVALNQFLIFAPAYTGAEEVWNIFPSVTEPFLGLIPAEWLTAITVSLLLGLLLLPLNMFIIRLFEGQAPGMKALLFPTYMRNVSRHKKLYAPIESKRGERTAMLAQYEESGEYSEESDFALQESLDGLHREKEKTDTLQTLPYDRARVLPTVFGNVWAVMEEYPHARYGLDSMVFWPYLRVVIGKENAELLEQIDTQKLLVDIAIHLSLVMAILAVEGVVFLVLRLQWLMLVLAVVAALLFIAFYQAAINYARSMATMVTQAFDLYRLKVLDAFGLARPDNLDDEYWVWNRLSAFIRRGEPFYFDMLRRTGEEE